MRFVLLKTVEQQELHRIRSELIRQRTSKVNQIRGLLGEYGLVVAQQMQASCKALPEILEDAEKGLSVYFRSLLDGTHRSGVIWKNRSTCWIRTCRARPARIRRQKSAATARHQPDHRHGAGGGHRAKRGPVQAKARSDRLIGIDARSASSGGKGRLLGISKRSDAYLRPLLIYGARTPVRTAAGRSDRVSGFKICAAGVTRMSQQPR
ncbi:transposase [Chromobacterium piscinae]|uniref:transposase n=1 Tax=Chromobacterium piscinae TaxID=686831 RepID=UPI001E52DFBA|nr:transposase [Chromobacterium piscinae]MCD4505762.1 transposase [Chromobacterium piscinae]